MKIFFLEKKVQKKYFKIAVELYKYLNSGTSEKFKNNPKKKLEKKDP